MLIILYKLGLNKNEDGENALKAWVNAKTTEDEFAPLHYASF